MARPSIPALIVCAALGGSYLVATDASAAGRGIGVSVAPPTASRTLAPGPGAFAPKRPSVDTPSTTRVPAGRLGPTYQDASFPDARGISHQTPQESGLNADATSVLSGNGPGFSVNSGNEAGRGASTSLNNGRGDALDANSQGASALSVIVPADAAASMRR
jgi:hypothetical protein